MASINRKKRQRHSCTDEYYGLRKKRCLDSNEWKKGGKYVPQQKSLKELKDELEGLVNYAKAQTQLNNQNARYCHGLVMPPFAQSR